MSAFDSFLENDENKIVEDKQQNIDNLSFCSGTFGNAPD